MRYIDASKDVLLSPDTVAKAMWSLVTNRDTYEPGTILEVCDEDKWRVTGLLNDSGPQGPASKTSRKLEALEEIKKILEDEANSA